MARSVVVLVLVALSFMSVKAAVDVTLHGPEQYVRGEGAPTVYTADFPGVEGVGTTFTISLPQASTNGSERDASQLLASSPALKAT